MQREVYRRLSMEVQEGLRGESTTGTKLAHREQHAEIKVQAAPWKEAMIAAVGKGLSVLRRLGMAHDDLKPQWMPARIYGRPAGGGRPIHLVLWSAKEGYGVKQHNLSLVLPNVPSSTLLERLNKCGRIARGILGAKSIEVGSLTARKCGPSDI